MPAVDARTDAPAAFRAAVASLRAVAVRPEVVLTEIPPPQRLAPWSFVLSADVDAGDDVSASGRLILLHDPGAAEAWGGTSRLVTYVTADVDPEMTADPLFGEVAWDWLREALDGHGAAYEALGGTVTRTVSTRFGDLSERPWDAAGGRESSDVEIRASWTPGAHEHHRPDLDLGPHLLAWCEVLCTTAGLPPPGVTVLRPGPA